MHEDLLIVSGGDAGYYPLLSELAQSIRQHDNEQSLRVAFLDGGLTDVQKTALQSFAIDIIDPGWCHPLAEKKNRGRDYLKINIAKLHLDRLFPEDKIILWVDGDTWFQNFNSLELFYAVANKNKLAVVSQASRLQSSHIVFKKKFGDLVTLRNILYKNGKKAGLSGRLLENLMARPTLNAGAYALKNGAPHWEKFRYWQDKTLSKGRLFTSDQLAFGLAVYEDGLAYEALPDICNYRGPWRWDQATQQFVDYYAPYDPVSIVHLCGQDEMRDKPEHTISMVDMADHDMEKSLRYSVVNRN